MEWDLHGLRVVRSFFFLLLPLCWSHVMMGYETVDGGG